MFNPFLEKLNALLSLNSNGTAIIDCTSNQKITVEELWKGAAAVARYLRECGICHGDNIVVTTRINERYCKTIYALFMIGAVPVFLDPGMPKSSLDACLKELSPRFWITDAQPLFESHLDASKIPYQLQLPSDEYKVELPEMGPDSPVLIIYTTGTTGIPKGVPWTCGNIASHLDVQNRQYGNDIRTEFILFAHLGIAAIAMGRSAVLPNLDSIQPNLIDIDSAVRQMSKFGCDYTFASPTYWKRLAAYCSKVGIKVENAKVVSTAGASVNVKILEKVSSVFPNAKLVIPYASTEVLMPICVVTLSELSVLVNSGTALGKGVPIGRPVVDMRVEVINPEMNSQDFNENSFLDKGKVGEIVVSGPRVTKNYFKRPKIQTESKLIAKDGTVWHRMGDMGYADTSGMIWFLCRRKHIRTSKETIIYPDQQEQSYNYQLAIDECAIVSPSGSNTAFLVVSSQLKGILKIDSINRIADLCRFERPQLRFYPTILPTDTRHNSKIDRESIEAWLTSGSTNEQHEGCVK